MPWIRIIIQIFNACNSSDATPFVLVRDLDSIELKYFWHKIRYTFYNDFFQVAHPKNLHMNLTNHLEGTKHAWIVEGSLDYGVPAILALSTCHCGR